MPWALASAWLILTSPLLADTPDPAELIRKAQSAVNAVNAVSYEAVCRSEWPDQGRTNEQTGKVTLLRQAAGFPKMKIETTPPTTGTPTTLPATAPATTPALEIVFDGSAVSSTDRQHKKFNYQTGPGAASLLMPGTGLIVAEFVAPMAFTQEMKAKTVEYVGTETTDAEECHVIAVQLGPANATVRWWLSTKDFLPRRVERSAATPEGAQKRTITLKALQVNPALTDDFFDIEMPDGYELEPPELGGRPPLLPPGVAAPDWTLKTPDGKTVTLKDLRGKVVVLDFWATWCLPCKKAMPGVQQLSVKCKDKPVAIYGVNTWERQGGRRPGDPVAFMKASGFTYPLLLDGDAVAQAYRVSGVPTFYVIGHDGKIVFSMSGAGKDGDLSHAVERALRRMK